MKLSFKNTAKQILLIACLCILFLYPQASYAGVTVTPISVFMEHGKDRYADLILINTNKKAATYEMGWRFFRMEEGTGRYINSDISTTEFDLSKHIVFTPKRITIAPGGSQKIRLAIRLKGETPPPGDYRAHLDLRDASALEKNSDIAVQMRIGYSLPVTYRVGKNTATTTISDVKTEISNNTIQAVVTLNKTSSPYSILGRLDVYHRPKNGKEEHIGSIANAHLFAEIKRRTIKINLNTNDLSNGTLRVVYKEREKDTIYDQKIIQIGR
jgi:fimbrial chaperone protein